MKLLMEQWKKYLAEIGDSSVEPYPFKHHKQFNDGDVFFEFKSDTGSQYYVNFNLGIEESINLPHLCSRNSFSEIEKTDYKNITAAELKLLGHDIVKKEMNSGLNIIWKNGNVWGGASDHRREGVAVGF